MNFFLLSFHIKCDEKCSSPNFFHRLHINGQRAACVSRAVHSWHRVLNKFDIVFIFFKLGAQIVTLNHEIRHLSLYLHL